MYTHINIKSRICVYLCLRASERRSPARSLALGPRSGCGGGEWLDGMVMATMNFEDHEHANDMPINNCKPTLLLLS